MKISLLPLLLFLVGVAARPAQGADCTPPDLGNQPYHRAVVRIKYLPETEAWSQAILRRGGNAQYVLMLDRPVTIARRCYWTLEARDGGALWARFFVSPDSEHILAETPKGPVALAAWRGSRAR